MKYYSILRPLVPGEYPVPDGNAITMIANFEEKRFCPDINQEAWGYVEYANPLSTRDILNYHLQPPIRKVKKLKFLGIDSWDRMVFRDEEGYLWKYTDPGEQSWERHDRLYSSVDNDFDGEPCWPMLPDIDYQIETDSQDTK